MDSFGMVTFLGAALKMRFSSHQHEVGGVNRFA